MAVDNVDLLPNNDVAEYWEEREDGWKRGRAIDDKKGHIVDFETVRQIADAFSILIGVSDDHYLVASIDKSLG